MEKKPYVEPAMRTLSLAIQETMLSSASGTGSDLTSTGDYNDSEFDDLFN